MQPSKYQQAIFDHIPQMQKGDNLVVSALAGSGKTTTIVKSLELLPFTSRCLFLAFNKSIAETLASRVPPNVEAATLNSFGWRILLKHSRIRPKLDGYKVSNICRDYSRGDDRFHSAVGALSQTISLLKAWAKSMDELRNDTINEIVDRYGIEIPEKLDFADFVVGVRDCFDIMMAQKSICDFDDQLYLPVIENMPFPSYDYVFVDEAQDLNPVQALMVERLAKGGRVIAVGDENQAIYGFRGADPDALPNLIRDLNAKVLPLSICYRCPKSVIKLAQNIVPTIEASDTAEDGIVATKPLHELQKMWADKDYVLCRITAPLVGQCLQMIREGRRACVKGRDIGQQLIGLIEKVDRFEGADFIEKLKAYEQRESAKLARLNRENELILLGDKCSTLEAIWRSVNNGSVEEMRQKINMIFVDNPGEGITFCTVHKAKGLEAKRIFILEPKLMPHPLAKKAWQQKQEMNLKYVAITRAERELYFQGS